MRFAVLGGRGFPSTYGGFETLTRHLVPSLTSAGHDVVAYGRAGTLRPDGRRLRPRTTVHTESGATVVETAGVENKALSTLSHGLTAALDGRSRQLDAALVLNVANGYFLPLFAQAGVPTVVNVDGLEWQRAKWGRAAKAIFRGGAAMTARSADRLVIDSRELAPYWRSRTEQPIAFIPYGAKVLEHGTGRDRVDALSIPAGEYLLLVARLAPENNTEMALDALEALDVDLPTVVVGSANYDNPLTDRLRHLARTRPGFWWLGHVHDQVLLDQLWYHSLIYFHGHSVGGTNPALLQAMGAGATVVALDTPFNREPLGDGGVTFGEPKELPDLFASLMDDVGLRGQLAQRAQQRIRDSYSWETVCESYERELLRAAGETPRVRRARRWRPARQR